ncbi:pyridoxine 5'-phosphate oxidase [bacterium 336/3]|nr:pyridoxine 5'-phosphate oxidase [bacterium 336/3]
MTKIADIRKEYKLEELDIKDVHQNPIEQFKFWFDEALKAQVIEPNAMFLATVSPFGQPTGRIVLLKGIEEGGFVFYTNYNSRKGGEITHNQLVSLTFFWADLERQVRIEGKALKVSEETSTNYFISRPRDSQIGAWASPQSQQVAGKETLLELFEKYKTEFTEKPLVKPPHWGGYVVMPHYLEFWQGRPSRMHDRICYTLENNDWNIKRIAP